MNGTSKKSNTPLNRISRNFSRLWQRKKAILMGFSFNAAIILFSYTVLPMSV
ncbi:AcvB/VirJ family lysyl-phosphatidylglycerol hydrolase [Adhaeribacter pallidiroseus]|uniref:AcvB/VirJ family lysyl-phosphatidylglycerol hydrolase n=1 Tax=Adhaeribacter pallidiroseus TaxID=2072847 RepID=UPI000E1B7131